MKTNRSKNLIDYAADHYRQRNRRHFRRVQVQLPRQTAEAFNRQVSRVAKRNRLPRYKAQAFIAAIKLCGIRFAPAALRQAGF